jgi:hypothetical protein
MKVAKILALTGVALFVYLVFWGWPAEELERKELQAEAAKKAAQKVEEEARVMRRLGALTGHMNIELNMAVSGLKALPADAIRIWGSESGVTRFEYAMNSQTQLAMIEAAFVSEPAWLSGSSSLAGALWNMTVRTPFEGTICGVHLGDSADTALKIVKRSKCGVPGWSNVIREDKDTLPRWRISMNRPVGDCAPFVCPDWSLSSNGVDSIDLWSSGYQVRLGIESR